MCLCIDLSILFFSDLTRAIIDDPGYALLFIGYYSSRLTLIPKTATAPKMSDTPATTSIAI